jgi:hypothetical protein
MTISIDTLSKTLLKNIDSLPPNELATYLLEIILTTNRAISSGTVVSKGAKAELGTAMNQVIKGSDRFSSAEYIQFREVYHQLLMLKIVDSWTRENLFNYEMIYGLIDMYLQTMSLINNYLIEGLSNEDSSKILAGWKPIENDWQLIKQYYQKKKNENLR